MLNSVPAETLCYFKYHHFALSVSLGEMLNYDWSPSLVRLFMFIIDINECTDNTHKCHAKATCTNTEGGYNCQCQSGHAGNGEVCTGTYLHRFFTNLSFLQHFILCNKENGL